MGGEVKFLSMKFLSDGQVNRLKAHIIAKRYTQTFGIDYFETFSYVAQLHSIRILLYAIVVKQWPLYQLDIKNTFLYDDLQEEIYMIQPSGYETRGSFWECLDSKRQLMG